MVGVTRSQLTTAHTHRDRHTMRLHHSITSTTHSKVIVQNVMRCWINRQWQMVIFYQATLNTSYLLNELLVWSNKLACFDFFFLLFFAFFLLLLLVLLPVFSAVFVLFVFIGLPFRQIYEGPMSVALQSCQTLNGIDEPIRQPMMVWH